MAEPARDLLSHDRRSWKDRMPNALEWSALVLFGLSILILVSLLLDPPSQQVRGSGGGFFLSRQPFLFLGTGTYILVSLVGFWSAIIFFRNRVQNLALKAFGITLMAVSFSTLLSLGSDQPMYETYYGGYVGKALSDAFGGVSPLITMPLVGIVFLISLVFATDWFFYELIKGDGRPFGIDSGRDRSPRRTDTEAAGSMGVTVDEQTALSHGGVVVTRPAGSRSLFDRHPEPEADDYAEDYSDEEEDEYEAAPPTESRRTTAPVEPEVEEEVEPEPGPQIARRILPRLEPIRPVDEQDEFEPETEEPDEAEDREEFEVSRTGPGPERGSERGSSAGDGSGFRLFLPEEPDLDEEDETERPVFTGKIAAYVEEEDEEREEGEEEPDEVDEVDEVEEVDEVDEVEEEYHETEEDEEPDEFEEPDEPELAVDEEPARAKVRFEAPADLDTEAGIPVESADEDEPSGARDRVVQVWEDETEEDDEPSALDDEEDEEIEHEVDDSDRTAKVENEFDDDEEEEEEGEEETEFELEATDEPEAEIEPSKPPVEKPASPVVPTHAMEEDEEADYEVVATLDEPHESRPVDLVEPVPEPPKRRKKRTRTRKKPAPRRTPEPEATDDDGRPPRKPDASQDEESEVVLLDLEEESSVPEADEGETVRILYPEALEDEEPAPDTADTADTADTEAEEDVDSEETTEIRIEASEPEEATISTGGPRRTEPAEDPDEEDPFAEDPFADSPFADDPFADTAVADEEESELKPRRRRTKRTAAEVELAMEQLMPSLDRMKKKIVDLEVEEAGSDGNPPDEPVPDRDPVYERAIETVFESDKASTALLQEKLKLNARKANQLLRRMETDGLVGPRKGQRGVRDLLITRQEFEESRRAGHA